jgi:predicted ester cyclase
MGSIAATANAFLEQCETGQGWEACRPFCTDAASFAAEAEPVAHITSLADYTEWMRALFTMLPNATYDLKALATDAARETVIAFAVFSGTHSGADGPVPATGRSAVSDYCYVMEFEGDKIRHLVKVWNAGWAMRQLGWQ